jgi:hypothetical protein
MVACRYAGREREGGAVSFQDRFNFHAPLDHIKSQGPLPMSDRPEDAGRGFISRDKEKTKPSQPDFKGSAEINGTRFWVSGWTAENDKGKYLKLSFRQAEQRTEDRQQAKPAQGGPDWDSQIPFEMEWR